MIKAGIVGGAGYTAGELIRILLNHNYVDLSFVFSTSNAGNLLSDVHQDLLGSTDIRFADAVDFSVDVVFLCLGHGNSTAFLDKNTFDESTIIIDLSNDFRLKPDAEFQGREFVYGLPELNRSAIKEAGSIANPGCFATAIQLALLPLADSGKIESDIHINAVTGATGAGTSLSTTTHYPWRDNNFSYYKPFTHQHMGEINQSVKGLQNGFDKEIFFLPNRGNFSRGIFATAYTKFDGDLAEIKKIYRDFYADAPFTCVSDSDIHMKQVVNTNKCLIHLHKHENQLLITSCIDNLLKGASGQAVENMNLIFGLPQTEGLNLKGSYF
ncbi:N-acetyl-gamma-glutamyl-phosphate reductase [Leeuwenhoekiella marinoflava]|uniref:N-acetyl-gamma-glutamyl-phosphate reductase n=2 Tax=Leeuwenhoekiella marinoflava TaxID=988 RepID=A0A4Q0PQ47_9FLAO|nr:N-acetyl-gamma-glutamyl-phosphate reductase [Leeuwenhoekiella marinoflava]RXG32740.1 N-acetyl-gamma-glutamyl-phosphate reductase [Leeuwenhoekiella marinoflava]SHE55346.1 N-acetyl-gamma-glutamyl-phosphate reductase [Leeuwenhoekiella marinoflava DSM 3653]